MSASEVDQENDVPVIVGSNANEMTTLTVPAQVPKTLDDYRKRLASQYGEGTREFDAFYPAKTDAEVATAYLDSLRDVTFTLPMRTWARMTATGRSKAYLYFFTHVSPNANSKYRVVQAAMPTSSMYFTPSRRKNHGITSMKKISDIWPIVIFAAAF